MKRQEQILEGLQALEIDNGNTLEIPDQSIEEVGNEDLGAWEYDESGPTSEELNSDQFELEESEVGDSEVCDSEGWDSEGWDNETSVLGEAEHEIED
jgi:hypothetical protein